MLLVALISAGAQPQPLTQTDFQNLMDAAVSAAASTAQAGTEVICVQRELESPLKLSKGSMDNFHMTSGMPGLPMTQGRPESASEHAAVEKAFALAISARAMVAPQTAIGRVPAPYVAYSSAAPMPANCEIPPIPGPGSAPIKHYVTRLILSQPVFASGYAFVDQRSECPGLCGSGWLRVFKKIDGKWDEVEYRNLFIS